MNILIYIAGLILIIFFCIQVYSLIMINSSPSLIKLDENNFPKVSLLLAARNEEALIIRSLDSIADLDYPPDKLQVLIGDDNSSDRTNELVREYIAGKKNFSLIQVTENLGRARGKGNVLAHLARLATGEFFFITDVDVQLPNGWIKGLLKGFKETTGIVSGTTMCARGSLFATMQSIDWIHFMGYIKAFANGGVSCTSVGNNMAVRASAYKETGGYEEMEFSITEDYTLFRNVTGNGWGWNTILTKETLGLAWYLSDPREMLHQRKRWLIGARELPLNWKIMIVLYGLFIPAIAVLFIYSPKQAMIVWGLKMAIQTIFISRLTILAGVPQFRIVHFIIYEFFVVLSTALTAIFYFLPIRSKWKGRKYTSSDLV